MNIKTCSNCNETFKPKRSRQVFCSAICQRTRGSKVPDKECARDGCTNTFKDARRTSAQKYCSRSCAATVNNAKYPKRQVEGSCEVCHTPIASYRVRCDEHTKGSNSRSDICGYSGCTNIKGAWSMTCVDCYPRRRKDYLLDKWLSGEFLGRTYGLPDSIREYIYEKFNYRCAVCDEQYFHPLDGKTVNQIDHINGDGFDHREENLRVLCPTHHALTGTYGNRNAGHGRDSILVRMQLSDIPGDVDVAVVDMVY